MNPRRIVALFRRVVVEIRRDRPSIAILFVAPILLTGLVSFILRESQPPAITAEIVQPESPTGQQILATMSEALRQSGATIVTATDEAAARAAVQDGSATVAISLPPDAGQAVILTLGLDAPGEASQLGAVQAAFAAASPHVAISHQTVYGTPTDDQVAAFAPAIVGFFAYFFVYVLTGVSFLRERTGGTLERLLATPVTRAEIVTGYTLGFGLFATLQVIVLLAWALGTVRVPSIGPLPAFAIGLGIPAVGSPVLAFLVVLLLAIGAVSLGIYLSTFARTELQIIQFIPLVLAPQFLLSGVIFPVSSLPSVLQPLVRFMPLNYAVDGLRQVFIRGADLSVWSLQADLLVLAAIALFFGVIASLTIRREVV